MSAPATQKIFGKEAKLFKDGKFPIYLLADGRFAIEWGGKWVARASLASVEKLIGKAKPSIPLFLVDSRICFQSRTVQTIDASEMTQSSVIGKDGKKHYAGYSNSWYLVDTPDRVAAVKYLSERIAKAEREFTDEFQKIMKGATQVKEHNFKKVLKKVQDGDGPDPEIFDDDEESE